ncbi:MAG: cobalamin-independent methionine synthase II family protein [Planctomycetota bacterium]
MPRPLPAFPVTTVGSWPRPAALLTAMKRRSADAGALADEAVVAAVRAQEEAGADLITDGEQRRDNFTSFLSERVQGFDRMSMADLLDHVEDKAAFETLLRTLDVPAYAIRNNVAVGRLKAIRPLVRDDMEFLRGITDLPIKATLPGPYILVRSSWVEALSRPAFRDRQELCDDVVTILRDELRSLIEAGVDMVQFDEPVLTELAFAGKSNTHTFMCAALAANANPESELDLAVELMNRVVDGLTGPIRGVHVCRGNWSRDESVLLQGSYDALLPHLGRMHLDQFVLEYATPRAGDPALLTALPPGSSVGFGVVNPRTDELENPRTIATRVRALAQALGHERIFLNPDCGFGTFAERPMNSAERASAKVRVLAEAAGLLRSGAI